MKPFLTKGYAKRKLHTGNQSVQFDEEVEVGKPLLYSTICGSFFLMKTGNPHISDNPFIIHFLFYSQNNCLCPDFSALF